MLPREVTAGCFGDVARTGTWLLPAGDGALLSSWRGQPARARVEVTETQGQPAFREFPDVPTSRIPLEKGVSTASFSTPSASCEKPSTPNTTGCTQLCRKRTLSPPNKVMHFQILNWDFPRGSTVKRRRFATQIPASKPSPPTGSSEHSARVAAAGARGTALG